MSSRDKITEAINEHGRTMPILRDAGNIVEKAMLTRAYYAQKEKSPFPQSMDYFLWNSQVVAGDVCQDMLPEDRKLVVGIDFLGTDGVKDGLRVISLKVNDTIILYEIIPTGVTNEFGKKNYNATVR